MTALIGPGAARVDGVDAQRVYELHDGADNGVVVKVAPGAEAGYGQGQAFMVLEEGDGDATDQSAAGSVLMRIDSLGSIGTTGGVHVASGLRKPYGGTQAVWIDPAENVHGVVIHPPAVEESAVWDKDYVQAVDVRDGNAQVFRVTSTGAVLSRQNVQAEAGQATQVTIGDLFGIAAIGFGVGADTLLYRQEAGVVAIANVVEMAEAAQAAAPGANRARLQVKDNGSGKTQLVVRFPTGAVQVLATEP